MEKQTEYLFYIGKQNKGKEKASDFLLQKTMICYMGGCLHIYSCLISASLCELPRNGWRWQRKRREKHLAQKLLLMLDAAAGKVREEIKDAHIHYLYVSKEIRQRLGESNSFWQEENEDLIYRLYEVCLWNARKDRKETTLSISLPKECGELIAEQMIQIVKPYLSRVNTVIFVGGETIRSQFLEDYFYEEYGIVMTYDRYPGKDTVWVDLDDEQEKILSKYAKENGICHINRAEVLKFLDTAAKNGYNTKVN